MPSFAGRSLAAGVIRARYSGASWIGTYRMPRQPPHRAFQDAPSRMLAAIVDGARNGTFEDGMLQVVRRDLAKRDVTVHDIVCDARHGDTVNDRSEWR